LGFFCGHEEIRLRGEGAIYKKAEKRVADLQIGRYTRKRTQDGGVKPPLP
jgi:hypothetical protein